MEQSFTTHKDNRPEFISWQKPLDPIVSYFKGSIKNVKPDDHISLSSVHNIITSKEFERVTKKLRETPITNASNYKSENFDYVTFHGVFTKREEKGIIKLSELFVVDLDHLGDNLHLIKERLISNTTLSPQLIFISPSGDGLKVIVRFDPSIINVELTSQVMNVIWQPVNTYFSKFYSDLITPDEKNCFIDKSGKDLSRACFIPYDPSSYLSLNDVALGFSFIDEMQPIEVSYKQKFIKGTKMPKHDTRSYSCSMFHKLAVRHLKAKDNHRPEILALVGACKSSGIPISETLACIKKHIHISEKSILNDFEQVRIMTEDIYSRYKKDEGDIKYLSPQSFGHSIWFFKHSILKKATISSLFLDGVRDILHSAGFARMKIGNSFLYIQKRGCIISEVSIEMMRDYLTKYVTGIEENLCFTYRGIQYEIPTAALRETYFKNSHNIFNSAWLEHLQVRTDPILKDTETEMYFCFKNRLVTVSKDGIVADLWTDKKDICVWEDQIIQRDFEYISLAEYISNSISHFYNFLKHVTDNDND